jgi:hypothetical protein
MKWKWYGMQYCRMILACLTVASVLGTSLDLLLIRESDPNKNNSNLPLQERNLSSFKRCLLSFSISRNFDLIFNTEKAGDSHLGCLHGFRVLTMGWVVMGHTYALTNHQAFGKNCPESNHKWELQSWALQKSTGVDYEYTRVCNEDNGSLLPESQCFPFSPDLCFSRSFLILLI